MTTSESMQAPVLELSDPLAVLLGALPPGGRFRYTYEDAVKLSGHSCPTVAGAYLMTAAALRALYPDSLPVRGEIDVTVGGAPDGTSSGPMSQVITLLTGAAGDSGFAGLAGRYARRDLLHFDPALEGRIRFRRVDNDRAVDVSYQPGRVPPSAELRAVMLSVLGGEGEPAEPARFAELWQARVAAILALNPTEVVEVKVASAA